MKTILLSLILIFSITLQAQTWSPLGANWKYTYFNGTGIVGYIEIKYAVDTIINSQTVKKLEKVYHVYDAWTNQFSSTTSGFEYTYEDNYVVYMLNNIDLWDTLFNFNASIGDSWKMVKQYFHPQCGEDSYLSVVDTGKVNINNLNLKYLVVDFHYGSGIPWTFKDTIIEKIGFINSYMKPYDVCNMALDVNEGGWFRCYSDDNFATYKANYSSECDSIFTNISDIEFSLNLSIYPNPVTSVLNIKGLSDPGNYSYNIYSMKGRLVQSGKLNETTEVTELSSGIYFLKLLDNFNSAYLKFIKH
jgi:hypothetical protein